MSVFKNANNGFGYKEWQELFWWQRMGLGMIGIGFKEWLQEGKE